MLENIIHIYVLLFAHRWFAKFNKLLFRLSLGGLGILNHKNSYLSGERNFLKNYLQKKEGVLIDVGANCGHYAEEAFHFNPSMLIYAIEPHPKTFLKLSKKFSKNKGLILINKALSSEVGSLKLYDYQNNDGSSHASLFEDVITEIHGSNSSISHTVEVTTLDKFVEDQKIEEISLLKIDTEGNELEVLRGGLNTLSKRKIKAIHFEFNEMNTSSRVFFKDFWKTLNGYKFYRLLPNDMLEIKGYNPLSCEIFAYQNIVAILED